MTDVTTAEPTRLRRIIAHPASLLLIGFVLMVAVGGVGSIALNKLFGALDAAKNTPLRLLGAVILAALFILAYKGYKRWIERAPDRELEFTSAGRELALGLAGGAMLFTVMSRGPSSTANDLTKDIIAPFEAA